MPAQLLALSDGPTILLDKPILLFGRHPECDVQLNSRKISRRHCCVAQVSDYLVVRDLGSTNGVRINGTRVNEGQLRVGDELTIGNFRYQICWDSQHSGSGVRGGSSNGKSRSPRQTEKIHDSKLEEAEEPVELDDLPSGFVPLKGQRAAELTQAGDSFMLPENLSLMPPNDSKNKSTPPDPDDK